MSKLTDLETRLLWRALRRPRARYDATRAAQLSGVPRRTLYDWGSAGVVIPDFADQRPKMWSYRDLVLIRLATWLRSKRMERVRVAERVSELRALFEQADEETFSQIRSDGRSMFLGDEEADRLTGQATLGAEVLALMDEMNLFDLEVPELGRSRIWGPHLVRPTEATRIYPWVMGGEPCVVDTRIPTSTLFALFEERALNEATIARLYPELSTERVGDAIRLERALRAGDRELVA